MLLHVLMLLGCDGDVGPQGPQGEAGSQGDVGLLERCREGP